MNRLIALLLAAAPFFAAALPMCFIAPGAAGERGNEEGHAGCLSRRHPREPGCVRRPGVGWAGIITRTEAVMGPDGLIHAVTTFEHHYFDWQEDHRFGHIQLHLSPRRGPFPHGMGVAPERPGAGREAAESFASPGKLPSSMGCRKSGGRTVVLRYRFLRVVEAGIMAQ